MTILLSESELASMINDVMPVEVKKKPTTPPYKPVKDKVQSKVCKTNLKKVMRKGKSEANLFELFGGGARNRNFLSCNFWR